jgi:uncharacterized protein
MAVDVEAIVAALAGDPEIVFAYLFGSQATGKARAGSDVDVAAFIRPEADAFETRLRLIGVLQAATHRDEVDVIVLNAAPISLAGRILTTRRVLVDRDPAARHRYESLTAREFFDFRFREHRLLEAMAPRG